MDYTVVLKAEGETPEKSAYDLKTIETAEGIDGKDVQVYRVKETLTKEQLEFKIAKLQARLDELNQALGEVNKLT